MKEQIVAPRGVRRTANQKGFAQKPARRDGSARRDFNFSPRALFAYVPKALKLVLVILIAITAIVGYRMAASASMFEVKTIDVTGTSRTSPEEIQTLTRRALSKTGVWRADLTALSNELSKLPGVRRAVVTRVLPDGLRVRITERVPIALVRTAAGHFVWVDDEGVALGERKPDDQTPPFLIRGWNDDGTEDARKDNAARVQKYLELARDWGAQGLTERVSEVDLADLKDVRVQLAGDDAHIEVRLQSDPSSAQLRFGLQQLDAYKRTPQGPSIIYVYVQKDRVTIGTRSGSRVTADTDSANRSTNQREASQTEGGNPQTTMTQSGERRPPQQAKGPAQDQAKRPLRFR
jgi:cell division protein FtsQ